VLENLNVRGMQVPFVSHTGTGDTIQVHFDYVAAIHTVTEDTGKQVSGTTDDQRLGELWTFQRADGAKTVLTGGATASKCPNCGAPLKLNDDGVCDYCKADITSGRYDWVATRIDQDWFRGARTAAAFGAAELDPQAGMATIQAEDTHFDPEAFRGRAQQAFFALQQAWQDRDLTASKPFMSPGLYLGWSSQVQQLIELHKKNVREGLRADSIDVVKVVHGRALDDVTVRMTATCADYEVDEQTGRVIFGSKRPSQFVEYWTFQRSVGVQTTERSILDKVCPNCGAPLEINQVGECRYCRAAVTSGRFDWVLSRIEQEDEYAG
jgi:predicted lipid-binding transport protein (Tim44 family)